MIRERIGIKRRPPKHLQKAYKELLSVLSKSKNTIRVSKTLQSSLKTLDIGKKVRVPVEDKKLGGYDLKEERFTYSKLVLQEFENEDGNRDVQHSNRFRKQKQRLKERVSKLFKAKK